MTHICVSKLTIIDSDNGLSPDRRQAIIWTNAGILLIRPLGTNFNEILIEIPTFLFTKMRLKVSSAKRQPFCLGLNVLTNNTPIGIISHSSSGYIFWYVRKNFALLRPQWLSSLKRMHWCQTKCNNYLKPCLLSTGGHFINDSSLTNQIRWEFHTYAKFGDNHFYRIWTIKHWYFHRIFIEVENRVQSRPLGLSAAAGDDNAYGLLPDT